MEIVEQLHHFETIEEMEIWLNQSESSFLRAYLLKQFDKLKYYETANQWNDVVKVCEALAILGWGNSERVDAICSRRDQWRSTTFKSLNNDDCYRSANWLPRKAGRYITNYSDYYGPSHQQRNCYKYVDVKEAQIVCTPVEKILSQRNYLVKKQFCFPGHLDGSDAGWLVCDLTSQLYRVMKKEIDPAPYANHLEVFCVWTSVGWAKDAYKFKPGRYYANQKIYNIYLHIDRDITDLSQTKQRLIIADGVREGVKAFLDRLKKRKLDFPAPQFEADVDLALDKFVALKSLEPLSEQENDLRGLLSDMADAVKTHQYKETDPTA